MGQHESQVARPVRQTVDIPTAGKMLGIGRSAAYNAASCGAIPTLTIGGRVLVPLVRLERMLEGQE